MTVFLANPRQRVLHGVGIKHIFVYRSASSGGAGVREHPHKAKLKQSLEDSAGASLGNAQDGPQLCRCQHGFRVVPVERHQPQQIGVVNAQPMSILDRAIFL